MPAGTHRRQELNIRLTTSCGDLAAEHLIPALSCPHLLSFRSPTAQKRLTSAGNHRRFPPECAHADVAFVSLPKGRMAQEHQALTLADLAADGTVLTPEEAVALTLSIAERLGWSEPPLDPALIVVRGDGTVHLPRPANAAPALPAQYAELLQRLLSFGRTNEHGGVPGALLLLLARARGEIDLPAFASADEFRHALIRFLPRPSTQVIATGMSRWRPAPVAPPSPARVPERRVTGPRVDELRRMLRDADLERIKLAARIHQQEAPATARRRLTPAVRLAGPAEVASGPTKSSSGPTKVGPYTAQRVEPGRTLPNVKSGLTLPAAEGLSLRRVRRPPGVTARVRRCRRRVAVSVRRGLSPHLSLRPTCHAPCLRSRPAAPPRDDVRLRPPLPCSR